MRIEINQSPLGTNDLEAFGIGRPYGSGVSIIMVYGLKPVVFISVLPLALVVLEFETIKNN